MSQVYYVNQSAVLEAFFSKEGVGAIDPTTVQLAVVSPSGVTTTLTLGGGTVVKTAKGEYRASYQMTEVGLHRYAWTSAGGIDAYDEGTFRAEQRADAGAPELTLAGLTSAVRDEIGDLNSPLFSDSTIARLLNEAQDRLGAYRARSAAIAWPAGAEEVELPVDFMQLGNFSSDTCVPGYSLHGRQLLFDYPASSQGQGRIDYWGVYPRITATQPCSLPEAGYSSLVAYACYRLMMRIEANRALFTRYATVTNQNAVTPEDIARIAEGHRAEWEDSKAVYLQPMEPA